ncbi:MAG: hypothetical protein ACR2RL_04160 [Gammaproteobacteria bacterium]
MWRRLLEIDIQIAGEVRAAGCTHCAGVLHGARYPRKPRGVPRALLGEDYEHRLSLCCSVEGCRRRSTPASVRFLGRRVYLGAVVLVLSALSHGLSARRCAELENRYGVSERTLRRWRHWWQVLLPRTPWWGQARARWVVAPREREMPASLLERFGESVDGAVLSAALGFVSPCSLSSFDALRDGRTAPAQEATAAG